MARKKLDYDKTSSVASFLEIPRTTLQNAALAGHVDYLTLPISGEMLISIKSAKAWNRKRNKRKGK